MRTRGLPILLLLLAVPAAGAGENAAAGRFTLYQAGQEAGAEAWTLVRKDGRRILESHLVLDLPAGRQELSLTAVLDDDTGELASFAARGVAGGRERLLRLVRAGDRLTGEIREGEEARAVSLAAPPGALPLLDPFTAPYLLLLERARPLGVHGAIRPVVYPFLGETGRVRLVARDEQAITLDGEGRLADRILAEPDRAETTNLWVDAGGDLLVAARSVAGLSAVRGRAARIGLRPGEDPPLPPGTNSFRVRFAGPAGPLAGSLYRPRGGGAVAAALLLSGSGPQDRNGNAPGSELQWSPLASFAEDLAARGVATLRYDERGVGASGGSFATAGVGDLLADARSALDYLASREDVARDRIFVVGHSEGALLAALLAAEDGAPVAGIVLLAPPARPLDRILVDQIAARLADRDLPERERQRILGQFRAFLEHVRLSTADTIEWDGRVREAKWLREHMEIDPVAAYGRVRVPALVVVGERDTQVPPSHGELAGAALGSGATVRRLPRLDHYLMAGTGDLSDYADAVRRVDPAALEVVGEWLRGRAR